MVKVENFASFSICNDLYERLAGRRKWQDFQALSASWSLQSSHGLAWPVSQP